MRMRVDYVGEQSEGRTHVYAYDNARKLWTFTSTTDKFKKNDLIDVDFDDGEPVWENVRRADLTMSKNMV